MMWTRRLAALPFFRPRRTLQEQRLDKHAVKRNGAEVLVFDHVPKTAGTTFRRSYLTAALPRDERWILAGGEENERDLERLLSMRDDARRRLRVVAGHGADVLRSRWPGARFITVIRDPVERAISSYLHALFHRGGESLWKPVRDEQMTLTQFVERYQPADEQSRLLLGADYATLGPGEIRARLRARYALVGCTEAFDAFIFFLHLTEGLPLCLFNNRLVRPERQTYEPLVAERETVRRHNAIDSHLHQVVRDDFQSRLDALPEATQAMLRRYLEALNTFRAETNGDLGQAIRLDEPIEDETAARYYTAVFGHVPRPVC
jgi:hypothetical protein